MNANDIRSEPDTSTFSEATQWLIDFREGDVDAEASRRFDTWLLRSPEHIQAYLEVCALWGDIPTLAAGIQIDVDAIVARARAHGNVVALGTNTSNADSEASLAPRKQTALHQRPQWWAVPLAATVLIALAAAWFQQDRGVLYATAIGEQRLLTLDDRSTIDLGPRSRVRVRFSAQERRIELLEGQALFIAAQDSARPFVVASDNTRVQAIGTQFDVHKRSSGTVITVLEGRVGVRETDAPRQMHSPLVVVVAGQQVTIPLSRVGGVEPRIAAAVTSPVRDERTLMFEDTPLADVVEEFNRYNEQQIVLADSALNAMSISGVFSATKPVSLLKFLQEEMHLQMEEQGQEIHLSSGTPKK